MRGCASARTLRRHRLPLPWFRRKPSEDHPREERVETPAVEAVTIEAPAGEPGADGDESSATAAAPKRRRGTRGGRNRRKTGTAAAGTSATAEAEPKPAAEKEKRPERKRRSQA